MTKREAWRLIKGGSVVTLKIDTWRSLNRGSDFKVSPFGKGPLETGRAND